jgi:hypothetical protein
MPSIQTLSVIQQRGGEDFMAYDSLITATVRIPGTDAGAKGKDAAADVRAVLQVLVDLHYCEAGDIDVTINTPATA